MLVLRYVSEQLRLGDLSGNKFLIVLRYLLLQLTSYSPVACRRVSCDDHVIKESFASLKEVGFVNYFGMQRFGTSGVPTHRIGR